MCGIAGYIGQSKRPKLSYDLITALFDFLETRGTDAAGVWGTELSGKGRIVYHKQPIRSSEFIKSEFWQKLRKFKLDTVLIHARATSKGGGIASENTNNHPFVSTDKCLAMVHNGTLDDADHLRKKYEMVSETDSELILRIYEHGIGSTNCHIVGLPDPVAQRVCGIKEVWSLISRGALAVALAERINDCTRGLFLFRNDKRPLWLIDLRQTLGQVFFFSSPDIWYRAVMQNEKLKKLCWGGKLVELPPNQVWYMLIDEQNPSVTQRNLYKFNVSVRYSEKEWEEEPFCPLQSAKNDVPVITQEEKPKPHYSYESPKPQYNLVPVSNVIKNKRNRTFDPDDYCDKNFYGNPYAGTEHEQWCDKIKLTAENIKNTAANLCTEGSMTPSAYQDLLESLRQTTHDLEGTLRILNT